MKKSPSLGLIVSAIASILWHTLNILLLNPKYELLDPSKPFVARFFQIYNAVLLVFVSLVFVETDIAGTWFPVLLLSFVWMYFVRFIARRSLTFIKEKTPELIQHKHALVMGIVYTIYIPLSSKLARTPMFDSWHPFFVTALTIGLVNAAYEYRLSRWLKRNPA